MSSDRAANIAHEVGNDLCSNPPLAVVRPEPPIEAASSCSEAAVAESKFGGTGRPSSAESERRRREFVRLVAAGTPLDEAARTARINPWRALALLDTSEMRQLTAAA